ncbi:hypothetical protein, conserved [Eimeria tenella]|uniref:RRM domain-containing protein n=1 Tax=Eimeria tenella TaxID=5802 RepID=U6KI69_EIMTE|nr:hypothetical protein, conserved [Eimeria tenella]CDJ37730.1 hypothetical protein, conserved [Eimeria tenella]|eukprot:XP_013228568.1 hypothetical protein, conserved [Eimeria tenella]
MSTSKCLPATPQAPPGGPGDHEAPDPLSDSVPGRGTASREGQELSSAALALESAAATVAAEGGDTSPITEGDSSLRRNRWADESDDLDSPAFDPMAPGAAPPPLSLGAPEAPPPPVVMEDKGVRELLVTDLDHRMTERDISNLFTGVRRVHIKRGDNGRSRSSTISAEVSFVSHEAVCAALAMNCRPIPRRGTSQGGARGDRGRGPLILKIQLPPPDRLDACFSKFRSGGLVGAPSAAASGGSPAAAAASSEGPRRGGSILSGGAGGSPLSRGGSGGLQGTARSGNLDNKWRKKGRSPDPPPPAAPTQGSSKEQQQDATSSSSSSNSNGTTHVVPLVDPKELLKEQLKPQGLKLNPAIFGEAKPRDETAVLQRLREAREGPSKQVPPTCSSPDTSGLQMQSMPVPPPPPPPPPAPQQQQQQQQTRWRSNMQLQQQQRQCSPERLRRRQDPLCGAKPRDEPPLISAQEQQQQQQRQPFAPKHHASTPGAETVPLKATAAAAGTPPSQTLSTEAASATSPVPAERKTGAGPWGHRLAPSPSQQEEVSPVRRGWRGGQETASSSSSNSSSSSSSITHADAGDAKSSSHSRGSLGGSQQQRNKGSLAVREVCAVSGPSEVAGELGEQQQQQQAQQRSIICVAPTAPPRTGPLASQLFLDKVPKQQEQEERQQQQGKKPKGRQAWQTKVEGLPDVSSTQQSQQPTEEGNSQQTAQDGPPNPPRQVQQNHQQQEQQQQQQGTGHRGSGGRGDWRGGRGDKRGAGPAGGASAGAGSGAPRWSSGASGGPVFQRGQQKDDTRPSVAAATATAAAAVTSSNSASLNTRSAETSGCTDGLISSPTVTGASHLLHSRAVRQEKQTSKGEVTAKAQERDAEEAKAEGGADGLWQAGRGKNSKELPACQRVERRQAQQLLFQENLQPHSSSSGISKRGNNSRVLIGRDFPSLETYGSSGLLSVPRKTNVPFYTAIRTNSSMSSCCPNEEGEADRRQTGDPVSLDPSCCVPKAPLCGASPTYQNLYK